MRIYLPAVIFTLLATSANAAIVTKDIAYKSGDTNLKGTLVYDDAAKTARPGVVVYPEWWGKNDYAKKRGADLASLGYTAFVADMYGDAKVTTDPKQATEWSGVLYKDRNLMRNRARAAVAALKAQPNINKSNIALTGYCFGGTNALELARAGDDVKGVAVFHAGLDFPDEVKPNAVIAHVLVMNGANDPNVPLSADQKFEEDMQKAGADVEVILYGNAQHAFTNPDADKFGLKGIAYNPLAEKRSMARLKTFLADLFGK